MAKNMESRLAEINQRLRAAGKDSVAAYQPYMVNTSARPAMLKP